MGTAGRRIGNITREILRLGIAPTDLYEVNPVFCRMLLDRHLDVTVLDEPAEKLAASGPQHVDAVVSGLPLLSMTASQQQAIVSAAFSRLGPDGVYIQFTYGLFSPLRRGVAESLGMEFTRSPRVWRNVPPAVVYVYRRKRN